MRMAAKELFDEMMSGQFKFVQTEDGSVPAIFHNNEDDLASINNFKRGFSAAFQTNFKDINKRVETDPVSLNVAKYTYVVSFFVLRWICNMNLIVGMRKVHKIRKMAY